MPTSQSLPSVAERAIRRRIARHGPITFADYMDAALYGPGGYYTRADANPPDDYYTAPQYALAFPPLCRIGSVRPVSSDVGDLRDGD